MILLDLGLPDMDGLDVLRKLRQVTPVPILILTARDDERSVVLGLRSGADDYLVKPVKLVELLARIEAVTRRAGRHFDTPQRNIVLRDLEIDLERRVATRGSEELPLTATEFDLLALLAGHAGSVVTREQILDALGETLSWPLPCPRRAPHRAAGEAPTSGIHHHCPRRGLPDRGGLGVKLRVLGILSVLSVLLVIFGSTASWRPSAGS